MLNIFSVQLRHNYETFSFLPAPQEYCGNSYFMPTASIQAPIGPAQVESIQVKCLLRVHKKLSCDEGWTQNPLRCNSLITTVSHMGNFILLCTGFRTCDNDLSDYCTCILTVVLHKCLTRVWRYCPPRGLKSSTLVEPSLAIFTDWTWLQHIFFPQYKHSKTCTEIALWVCTDQHFNQVIQNWY